MRRPSKKNLPSPGPNWWWVEAEQQQRHGQRVSSWPPVDAPAGPQRGWMSHKEAARALHLPHGATGSLVSSTALHFSWALLQKKTEKKTHRLKERIFSLHVWMQAKALKIAGRKKEINGLHCFLSACCCCCPWSCPALYSHNLEYDSSEEKNPRLIFYSEKDEVVKVRRTFGDVFLPICLDRRLIRGAAECQVGFTRRRFTTVASDIRSRVWLGRLWNAETQRKQKEKWEIFSF